MRTAIPLLSLVVLAGCSFGSSNDAMMMDEDSSSSAMMEQSSSEAMMEGKSSLTFVGGSSIVDHDGGFADFTVELSDSSDLQNSTVTAIINVDSIYTDSDGLTGHLKKEEFFNVDMYKTANFTSTEVVAKGGNSYDIVGDLTVKGVTKSVILNATMEGNKLTASFELPRKEYGIGNDSYGDKLLDETVPVTAVVYIQ